MTKVNINPIDTPQFKNGDNIHFDYTDESSIKAADRVNSSTSSNKKKKKRKKNKPKVDPTKFEATLNNPEDDYPTSRVIKQAPNGDVIVESLDDVPLNSRDHYEHHDHHHDHIPHANIWDNATIEEQENLKAFWESLNDSQKLELVQVDKKSIMDIFKSETKSVNHNANSNPQQNNGCSCSYCGKKNNIIEDELENIYDNHFDDIIDFIHEVRDINDLNALPGLLFGGFHMLEEEHKLHKRQQKFKNKKEHILNKEGPSSVVNQVIAEDNLNKIKNSQGVDHFDVLKSEKEISSVSNKIESNDSRDIPNLRNEEDSQQNNISDQEVFNKLLDPKLTEALESFDLERMKETETLEILLQRANSLREMIKDLHKADKDQLEKGMAFLQNMGKIINGDVNDQISQGLSKFAEDLLKNDGNSFIEMMESLSESRTEREDLLKESIRDESAWVDEDDRISEIPKLHSINIPNGQKISNGAVRNDQVANADINFNFKSQANEEGEPSAAFENVVATPPKDENGLGTSEINEYSQKNNLVEEKDEDEEDCYDEEGEEYEDDDDDFEKEDRNYVQLEGSEEEDVSDTESEISEEEKMQEIRRLFLIQVIKLFQERLKNAYKEKLAEDRTQRLIEELEAEENAKKEKELKKLKQKEKAKEKKRLQQLAKEEERKKKEEEQKEKELELQRKQEELRAAQRRKKEEAKQKREEEKKKRIEELRRKEEEQRKKAEAQRKREEEAKRLKEERRKKSEEERKRKEEEKKQKDLERKQEEEKRRKEKEILLAQTQEYEKESETDPMGDAYEVDQSFDELLNIQNVTEKLSNTELHELLPVEEKSPSKNHLLEQLYHAKPGSFSSAPKSINPQFSTSTTSIMPSLLSPTPSHILPNNILPNQNQVHNNDPPIGNWSNHNAINTQPLFNNLYASTTSFSPFDGFPSNNGPSLNSQKGLTSTVWNQPSNSIWGNTNSNSTPLWNSVNNHTTSITDTEIIQSAAFNAFQLLQDSNMLEFGAAHCITLFQNTKTLLNSELTLNQFLSACRTSSRFTFDLIYNNFGTVTHVKVTRVVQNQPIGTSAPELVNGLAPLNNFNTSDSGNILNGFNDINDPAFSGVRNLWN